MNYTPRRHPLVARLMWRQALCHTLGLPLAWATSGVRIRHRNHSIDDMHSAGVRAWARAWRLR